MEINTRIYEGTIQDLAMFINICQQFPITGITFKLMEATVARGVFTYFGGTGTVRDVINVAPPFIIEEDEMDMIVAALDEGISAVCQAA